MQPRQDWRFLKFSTANKFISGRTFTWKGYILQNLWLHYSYSRVIFGQFSSFLRIFFQTLLLFPHNDTCYFFQPLLWIRKMLITYTWWFWKISIAVQVLLMLMRCWLFWWLEKNTKVSSSEFENQNLIFEEIAHPKNWSFNAWLYPQS
jgi:hypothetical protein